MIYENDLMRMFSLFQLEGEDFQFSVSFHRQLNNNNNNKNRTQDISKYRIYIFEVKTMQLLSSTKNLACRERTLKRERERKLTVFIELRLYFKMQKIS